MIAAIAPIVIALISLLLRVMNLGSIKSYIFDEVYYVDGARDLLKYGVEVSGAKPEFIVHPPLGKWMIASGIKVFGDNPFGWRIATAVVGSLLILVIALVAHKLFRDPLLTGLALVLGLALATKWSALYFIIAFGLIAFYRAFSHHTGKNLVKPTVQRIIQFGVIPVGVYLTSWSGWFASNRGWARDHSTNILNSFIYYHQQMLGFHTGLTEKHVYEANPWSWLFMGRPTSFFYESPKGCGAKSCSQEIIALGTPLLWWLGIAAISFIIGLWVRSFFTRHFDPAITVIITGLAAGYLPWFFFQERTVFTFYAIIFEPFVILALVFAVRSILATFKVRGEVMVAALFILIFLNFVYFLPIFLGEVITYDAWQARMWFPSWI